MLKTIFDLFLPQIETLANELGLQIAGYYVACEQFYDNSIEKAPGVRIAEKIVENNSNACFAIVSTYSQVYLTAKVVKLYTLLQLQIDNISLNSKEMGPALHLWNNTDNRWNPTTFHLEKSEDTLDAVEALLERGAMKDLFDFDNHLDNIENDWTNEHLNRDLTQLLSMY